MSANKLIYKGFTGSLDASLEDECLVGKVLFIDDIVTYEGDTVPALKANFQAAVDRYLAYCEKTAKRPTSPTAEPSMSAWAPICGGDKSSQPKVIRRAKELWAEWKRRQT